MTADQPGRLILCLVGPMACRMIMLAVLTMRADRRR